MCPDRPVNRQGRARKWGDHCTECGNDVPMQSMRHGLCGTCYQRGRRSGALTTTYVDPQLAREHLARIYATGKSYRWIAKQAGTNTVQLNHVAKGTRRRISREIADKIISVPVPESVDEPRLKLRALQTAGLRGVYVGVERRYRQSRTDRGVAQRRRDPKRHSLKATFHREREEFLAQFDAERDEFMRWLYEGTGTPIPTPQPPAITHRAASDWLDSAMCGECEHRPCRCGWADDHDLCWLPTLADHDAMPALREQAAA